MRNSKTVATKDGIKWHVEQEGSGPDIVLIPDGIGECKMFDKPVSLIAAQGFRVTTFDMPGFSRSSEAPADSYEKPTAQKLARYILTLLDELEIEQASFFGCSSGASTVLALLVDHSSRVRSAIVHEAPTYDNPDLSALSKLEPDEIVKRLETIISIMSGNKEAWDAMGDEALARIRKNFVTWARSYPIYIPSSTPVGDLEALKQRPLDWTVGAQTATAAFIDNIVTATKAGVSIGTLPGLHFPYVSHPEEFAAHVVEKTKKHI